jgi:hypothetical protein
VRIECWRRALGIGSWRRTWSRFDIYGVQLRWKTWNTWEVSLGWVNWLGVSRVIMVIKPPIRFQEYARFHFEGTSYHVIISQLAAIILPKC